MPDLFEVIRSRRSIRKFLPREVPKELVLDVLSNAGWAPSAHNAQPYGFIVLENAKIKQELADAMAQVWVADLAKDGQTIDADKLQERVERFAKAPVLILACVTGIEGLPNYSDERRRSCLHDLAVQSLGAAIENLLWQRTQRIWGHAGIRRHASVKETVRETLAISHVVEPQAFVVLGYPAETPTVPKKKSLSEFCFVDLWGKPF